MLSADIVGFHAFDHARCEKMAIMLFIFVLFFVVSCTSVSSLLCCCDG